MYRIRPAVDADGPRICELIYAQPDAEAVTILGDVDTAGRFGALVMEAQTAHGWRSADVVDADGEIVGVLQHGAPVGDPPIDADLIRSLVRVLGARASWRLLSRGWVVQRVRLRSPPDSWVVRELHVDAAWRGQGIGGDLLAHAERQALAGGVGLLSLTVRSDNPARRLYERAGYREVASRSNRHYERLTGAQGRVLMVKTLQET